MGLGNPGERYDGTRHNIGFRTIDVIAGMEGVSFSKDRLAYHGRMDCYGNVVYLLKPLLFMNRSGEAVAYWVKKLQLPLSQLLVVVDDLHLPLGSIRLRGGGGSGGHNGLKDITNRLGGDRYPRLRLGIGRNYVDGGQGDYVLGRFKASERKVVDGMVERATEAVFAFCRDGLEVSMSVYN